MPTSTVVYRPQFRHTRGVSGPPARGGETTDARPIQHRGRGWSSYDHLRQDLLAQVLLRSRHHRPARAEGEVKVNDSKASLKRNVAVGLLLIAAVLASYKGAGKWAGLFLAVALAVAVGRLAYERGYEKGQRDLLDPSRPLTEDQRNTLLMRLTLSAGRRYFGWIVMIGSLIIGQSLAFIA